MLCGVLLLLLLLLICEQKVQQDVPGGGGERIGVTDHYRHHNLYWFAQLNENQAIFISLNV